MLGFSADRATTGSPRYPVKSRNLFLLPSIVLVTACATAPVQEMSNARQALDAARSAGADQHAPGTLKQAETLLKKAEEDLAAQEYARARNNADAARDAAIKARAESQQKATP